MKERFAKLIDVKSIVTILLTATFVYLSIKGVVPEPFSTIYTTVTAFYFGTQVQKKSGAQ